jgi:hypothetical protein
MRRKMMGSIARRVEASFSGRLLSEDPWFIGEQSAMTIMVVAPTDPLGYLMTAAFGSSRS